MSRFFTNLIKDTRRQSINEQKKIILLIYDLNVSLGHIKIYK